MKKYAVWIVIIIVLLGAALWGPIVSNVEQAKYTVAEKHENIEIRDYAPMIVAEVDVSGNQNEAISQGFRMIADYIFGNNQAAKKVAMTAPVTQQQSEKIAMTAPVIQQGDGTSWNVRFVMPANYTMQTLPKPNVSAVKLKEVPGKTFAVICFSGVAREKSLKKHALELQNFINAQKLSVASASTYAFYNPPWTLPFLRRNEVMIELMKK